MKVDIKIYFDDDEKIRLQKIPDYVKDDAVQIATQRGLEVINGYMLSFMNIVTLYGYLGDKGGEVS